MIVAIFQIFLVILPTIVLYKIIKAFVYRYTKDDDRPGTTSFFTAVAMFLVWMIFPHVSDFHDAGDADTIFFFFAGRYFLWGSFIMLIVALVRGHDSLIKTIRGD